MTKIFTSFQNNRKIRRVDKFVRDLRFSEAARHVKPGRVLDFGCRDGYLKTFIPETCEYIGFEGRDYSKIKGEFDTIFVVGVIEHIELEKVPQILKMLFSHLKNEGILIITTPSKRAHYVLAILVGLKLVNEFDFVDHKHYWNLKELELLGKYGEIVKLKKFMFGFNQLLILKNKK